MAVENFSRAGLVITWANARVFASCIALRVPASALVRHSAPAILPSVSGGEARHQVAGPGPFAVSRPALVCHRLAGKQPILLDEARAGAVTEPVARPAQVPEGQLTHGALRRLHDKHDRAVL
jgi:hypothetical protein